MGERDFSAQETCHLLLQLPLTMCSIDFVVLSLDGSRVVEDRLEHDQPATALSILDHYKSKPATLTFDSMTLLHFAQHFTMPCALGQEPTHRGKEVVVVVKPHCPSDSKNPHYEQYCRQKLMLHKSFRNEDDLVSGYGSFTSA